MAVNRVDLGFPWNLCCFLLLSGMIAKMIFLIVGPTAAEITILKKAGNCFAVYRESITAIPCKPETPEKPEKP